VGQKVLTKPLAKRGGQMLAGR